MCDCINRIEELLTKQMLVENPNSTDYEPVEFQNKTLIFNIDKNKTDLILSNKTLGRVKFGKITRKFSLQMMPKFCPYCGEALNQ